ncbi:MAG: hypothetical protein U0235_06825 [Polyangiaceae bacterium]
MVRAIVVGPGDVDAAIAAAISGLHDPHALPRVTVRAIAEARPFKSLA